MSPYTPSSQMPLPPVELPAFPRISREPPFSPSSLKIRRLHKLLVLTLLIDVFDLSITLWNSIR